MLNLKITFLDVSIAKIVKHLRSFKIGSLGQRRFKSK